MVSCDWLWGPLSLLSAGLCVTLTLETDQPTLIFTLIYFAQLLVFLVSFIMETRYNLRRRKECHIPVQVQLASDAEFLAVSWGSMDPQHTGQVLSEQSDSGSDIDISGLLDISNQNLSFSDSGSVNHGAAVGGTVIPRHRVPTLLMWTRT